MDINELKEHNQIKESVITLLGEAKDVFSMHFGESKEENIHAFNELSEKTKEGRICMQLFRYRRYHHLL